MNVRFNIVDVFTDTPLTGNQLAVFTNASALTDGQMQTLAREIGFSESTFILPPQSGGHARIRIFTPERELPFAGHPVLGTSFVLAGPLQLLIVNLETAAGTIPVQLEREGAKLIFGWMTQPIPTWRPFEKAQVALDALGVAKSELAVEVYDNGVQHAYVMLASDEDVAALDPDMRALAELGDVGVSVFAASGSHAKTRCFCPGLGVDEDPATGSAAGPLAVLLARNGILGWGEELEIAQGAEIGRPSSLYARVFGDKDALERVEVGGSAVVVARGEYSL